MASTDPLQLLPSEIVLRILEFSPTASLASLTRLNRSWHGFIDKTHQEAIYSTPSRTPHPPGSKDLRFLKSHSTSFHRYFDNVRSWKDLCKRQTLLARNWGRETPFIRDSTIRIGHDPIWRFRPDFQRRIILSTSHAGGLNVTDMDSGEPLWSLDTETVRPFAHLEYQDGTAVWDCEGNGLEVWRTGVEGSRRGEFVKVAVLEHDRTTRGFQLSYGTLCVVSNEGVGFVYRGMLAGEEPNLERRMEIEEGVVGHLDQGEQVVVYSMGDGGYHFLEKATGRMLGVLDPEVHGEVYYVKHPEGKFRRGPGVGNLMRERRRRLDSPSRFVGDRTVGLEVRKGAWPWEERIALSEDEWGAGMLRGDLFVGVSRGGRLVVCSNWRKYLDAEPGSDAQRQTVTLLECDTDGSNFDLGGWLSVRGHRVMFEIQDLIYIIGLTDDDRVRAPNGYMRSSFATSTSITAQLAVPVSFMGIYEDCIMTTYTTLHYRRRPDEGAAGPLRAWNRILPTKAVAVLSLAPELAENEDRETRIAGQGFGIDLSDVNASQADLYRLIAMLSGDGADDDDGWGENTLPANGENDANQE